MERYHNIELQFVAHIIELWVYYEGGQSAVTMGVVGDIFVIICGHILRVADAVPPAPGDDPPNRRRLEMFLPSKLRGHG